MFGRNESTVFKALKSKAQVVTIGQIVVFDELNTDTLELGFA